MPLSQLARLSDQLRDLRWCAIHCCVRTTAEEMPRVRGGMRSGGGGLKSPAAQKAAIVLVALGMRIAIAYVSDYSGRFAWQLGEACVCMATRALAHAHATGSVAFRGRRRCTSGNHTASMHCSVVVVHGLMHGCTPAVHSEMRRRDKQS